MSTYKLLVFLLLIISAKESILFACPTSAPSLLTPANGASGVSPTGTLDWSDVQTQGPFSYTIQVSTNANFTNVVRSATVGSSIWTISPALSMGATYYWRVRPNDACGSGPWSSVRNFVTCSIPTSSTLVSPANGTVGTTTTPFLDWNNVTGASGYRIEVATNSNFSPVLRSSNPGVSQWTVSPALTNNSIYYWRARASNTCGSGSWSPIWNFKACTVPGVPSLTSPANNSSNIPVRPNLDWNNATAASSYFVEVSTDSSFINVVRSSLVTTSIWTVTPALNASTTYYWRARSTNSCSTSAYSSVRNFSTSAAPSISSISPNIIPFGQTTTVTVIGANFQGASVSIPQTKYDPNLPNRIYPSAQIVSITPAGNQMTININASAPGVDNYYNLAVQTAGGYAAAQFRVISPGPVVDFYTPSEAAIGDAYFMVISGLNLQGTTITPTDPGVVVLNLDNTQNDRLMAVLNISEDAILGPSELQLQNATGTAELPLEIQSYFTASSKENTNMTVAAQKKAEAEGKKFPTIYLQEPTLTIYSEVGTAPLSESSPNTQNNLCFEFFANFSISYQYFQILPFDEITGKLLDLNKVAQLFPGTFLDFNISIFSVTVDIELSLQFALCDTGFTDLLICLSGQIDVMIPFVGGQSVQFLICFGLGGYRETIELSANGFLLNYNWSSSSDCVEVIDVDPESQSGTRPAKLRLDDCCDEPVEIVGHATGVVFSEEFDIQRRVIRGDTCKDPIHKIRVAAFIPFNYVHSADYCDLSQLPDTTAPLHKGDDRSFSARARTDKSRLTHLFSISQNGPALPIPGLSKSYALDALDHGVIGLIDPSDDDPLLWDCILLNATGTATIDPNLNSVENLSDSVFYKYRFRGSGENPLVGVSPGAITWDLSISVDKFPGEPHSFFIAGTHDCFPGYEIAIDDKLVYGYYPPSRSLVFVGSCLAGFNQIVVNCEGTIENPGPCISSGNAPPISEVTYPQQGATFGAPASFTISADADDFDGDVAKVEFFQGSTKLGEDISAPYSFGWNGVPEGTYSLTAKASDNIGSQSTSSPVTVTVNPSAPPNPPTGLVATAVSESQINLSWVDASNSETGFTIYARVATSPYASIGTVAANVSSFSHSGLSSGSTLYYAVRSFNAAGSSGYSNEASATTLTNNSLFISQSAPPLNMVAGQTYAVSVSMKNTGTTTWTSSSGYKLGAQNPVDNMTWGFNRVVLPAPVSPGGQTTFNFTITAPSNSGAYNFQWQMLRENVQWFGSSSTNIVVTVGNSQTPYPGTPFALPGLIQSEDFDNGGEGVAYHDLDAGNNGGVYRSTGVDLSGITDVSGGYCIGWIYAGEWVEYTVNVPTPGTYTVEARVAHPGNGGTFHIEFNGVNVTGPMTIPNTGGWDIWQTIRKNVTLNAGQQVMRIAMDSNGSTGAVGNINHVRIVQYQGYLDAADCQYIAGWAWDKGQPNTPINVDIYSDSVLLATYPANAFRQDLLNAGIGNGYHAFAFPVPASLKNGQPHSIAVKYSGTNDSLIGSPKTITCGGASISIVWIKPAEETWGPPGSLTAAGYALGGSGTVQLVWRNITLGGGWNTVAYQATPGGDGSWSNSIPAPTNKCHTYQAYANYSGVSSSVFTYNGVTEGDCTVAVVSGTYGGNCGAPTGNATWHLAPACNGQTSCNYTVNVNTLGDPVPGCAKNYVARWTCGGGSTIRTATAPPEAGYGSVVNLVCN